MPRPMHVWWLDPNVAAIQLRRGDRRRAQGHLALPPLPGRGVPRVRLLLERLEVHEERQA